MADVHPQRDLGVAPVAAEMALPDQDAHDQAALGVGELPLLGLGHAVNCFTVRKNVKHPGASARRRGAGTGGGRGADRRGHVCTDGAQVAVRRGRAGSRPKVVSPS